MNARDYSEDRPMVWPVFLIIALFGFMSVMNVVDIVQLGDSLDKLWDAFTLMAFFSMLFTFSVLGMCASLYGKSQSFDFPTAICALFVSFGAFMTTGIIAVNLAFGGNPS